MPGEVLVGRLKDGVEVEEEGAEREEKDAIGASSGCCSVLARWLVARFCEVVGLLGHWVILLRLGRGMVRW